MIDPQFRVVAPPVDAVVTPLDATIANWVIVLGCITILVAIGFVMRKDNRPQMPVLLLMILGGAIAYLAEPFVDLLGACWHPAIGQNTLFEHMGRPMPLWLLTTYTSYFGVQMMYTYYFFNKGASTRVMWLWFVIPVISDIILEESLLSLSDNLYIYYANQPLMFHKFPLWWAPGNTIGIYLSAVVMTMFVPLLRGWRLLLVPFSTLMCYGAATGLVAFPSIVVINSDFPFWATQLGGILTFALAALVVHGCTRLIATDSPYNVRKALAGN